MDLNENNLLFYCDAENYKLIKKDIKSVKKIRKNTNLDIIKFYGKL